MNSGEVRFEPGGGTTRHLDSNEQAVVPELIEAVLSVRCSRFCGTEIR
jgi:hypothetical protein